MCSRYDGSRLLVVRGNKNLDTCGLMEHKLYKKDTNMDIEHSRIKVTYERPAEELGLIDIDQDLNTAREDTSDDLENKNYLNNQNKFDQNIENNLDSLKSNNSKRRHRKRHAKRWQQNIQKLKNMLESKF